jgi:hypothetical protein
LRFLELNRVFSFIRANILSQSIARAEIPKRNGIITDLYFIVKPMIGIKRPKAIRTRKEK